MASNKTSKDVNAEILEAFGLKSDECEINKELGRDNAYRISSVEHTNISSTSFNARSIFNQYELSFYNCDFQTPAVFLGDTFTKPIRFIKCRFMKEVKINATFNEIVLFRNTTFEDTVSFDKSKFLIKDIFFQNAVFQKQASLSQVIFEKVSFNEVIFRDKVRFSESTFNGNAIFKESIFNGDAYFDMVTFMGQADFGRCKFDKDKSAYFYETVFKVFPNFIQTIFDGSINFTNTELDFDYKDIEARMGEIFKEKLKYYRRNKNKEHYPRLYKVTNEIRNVFRNIKNSLIEDRNMLDASNYHRVELYCKELELKYRRKEKAKKSGVRDVVDRIHLMLYRLTSDHHTDLLLILNNVVILIALFGVANFTLPRLNQFDTLQFEFLTCCISLLEFLNCIAFVGISIFILLHRKLTLKKSYRICLKTIKNNFVIILPYIAFMFYVLFNYPASVCLLCIAFSVPLLYFMVYMLAKRFHIKIAKKITLTLAYLMFGFMFIIRNCMLCIAYIVAFIMLFCSPSSILPILGKLIENKTSESCHCNDFDIFGFCYTTESVASEALNLIYMFLLFLLLFSLQKTARKNTIVPN